jgi:hypothetical protein
MIGLTFEFFNLSSEIEVDRLCRNLGNPQSPSPWIRDNFVLCQESKPVIQSAASCCIDYGHELRRLLVENNNVSK